LLNEVFEEMVVVEVELRVERDNYQFLLRKVVVEVVAVEGNKF